MNELELIDWLTPRLPTRGDVLLGAGDDCALVQAGETTLAVTTDQLLEGVHFRPTDPPAAVGWKTLAVSLSDLAAMGCEPRWAVTSLGMRRSAEEAWPRQFAEGVCRCADAFDTALIGGDYTVGDGPVSLSLTALGTPMPGGPVRRTGARVGDVLAVTGSLGGSIHRRHLAFTPRLAESRTLCAHGGVRAMMDLSDGMATDLRRLCRASRVGAQLEAGAIPIHEDVPDGPTAARLHHALQDGEDFELLVVLDPAHVADLQKAWRHQPPLSIIGVCTDAAAGVMLQAADGAQEPMPGEGFVHGGGDDAHR